ncbi:MAG TPA: hypothetical protein PLS03_13915 [Terrimicrobiaceae bacterium]|nr:hypothetical protein [Terrimicrobiaceae bacterium]
MKVFYTPKMVAQAGGDSPSPRKPPLVVEAWKEAGIPLDIEEPDPVTVDDFSLAHDRQHVEDILALRKDNGFGNADPEVAASLTYTTGSMVAAARWAIRNKTAAVAPCSGFHHAMWDYASMFCTFNGLMVTAFMLQKEGLAARVAILDCDQHFGNGTNQIICQLKAQEWVAHSTATLGYSRDISLLERLPKIIEEFSDCDVVLYQAGADPHMDDPYGGFLTTEQLALRDRIVFSECRRRGLSVAWNLAGGYQDDLNKVIEIHVNTALACEAAFPSTQRSHEV